MSNRCFTGIAVFSLLFGMTAIVSAEEADAQSADLFKQLDQNKDGKVTKGELNEKQAKFFDRLVRTGDKNNDGELSKEEFTSALGQKEQPVEVKGGKGKGRGRGKRDFSPEAFFKKLDKNGDGKVAKAEIPEKLGKRLAPLFEKVGKDEVTLKEFQGAIKSFRAKSGKKGRNKQDPKKLFEMFDKNKDGKITLEEIPEKLRKRLKPIFERLGKDALTVEDLAKLTGKRGKEGKGKDRAAQFFKKLDKNGDGKIQKDEVPEKLRERFGKMDANGDGVLDEEEVKKAGGKRERSKGKKSDKKKRSSKKDGKRPEKVKD